MAIGGDIVVPSAQWSHQREAVSSSLIRSGLNTILFTSPSDGVKYKVKNLKIVFDNDRKSYDNIIVSSVLSGSSLYVKGSNINGAGTTINNEYVSLKNGEFEKLIQVSESDKAKGSFSVTADGVTNNYKIPAQTASFKTFSNTYSNAKGISVSNDQEFSVEYEGINIKVEKGTSEAAYLEVLKLRSKDFPATSQGLKNVTVNNSAYRLSVISGKLNKKVKLTIPYDEKRLGLISPKDIKTFHFDYARRQWIVEKAAVVDTKTKTVTVEGDGDTDYINGVISTPEAPQLGASNPTGISGLKAINPTVGRNFIAPPTANQKGTASVSYPIVIPSGRKGMQPSLSLGYDSSKGNGWMGEGWDINGLSAISIDTRWGAPRFDQTDETELYSMDGAMLVYDNSYLPHRHNDISEFSTVFTTDKQKRTDFLTNNKKKFFLRKNHNFSKIERYGTTPSDYRWVVTTPSGGKIFYGGDKNSVNTQSVIRDANNNIVHWAVWKEMDVNGNYVEYVYDNYDLTGLTGVNQNLNNGKYFHIQKILYTNNDAHSGLKLYSVEFEKEGSIVRQDISINAKKGVKEVEPYRLNKIYVKYDGKLIRTYSLTYKEGEFYKTLLTGLKHIDTSNDFSYNNLTTDEYVFDYYDDIKDATGNTITNFGGDSNVNANIANVFPLPPSLTPSKIQANSTFEWGVNGRLGLGLNFLLPTQDPYGHAMISGMLGYSEAKARNVQQLIDFNGDGVQDIIYRKPNTGLFVSPGSLASGSLAFGAPKQISNLNSDFSYTKTKTDNKGYDFGLKVFGLGYNRSFVWSTTRSTTSTYLTDANSDGLMDVVKDGQVWFNRLSSGGINEMTNFSDTTENMVIVADDALQNNDNESGLDVVKFWVAPKDGIIKFTDNISIENVPNAKAVYSVEILNPASGTTPTNGRIYLKILTPATSVQNISITKYNTYFSDIQSINPVESNNHLAINNPGYLTVKSGDKVFVRLHKNNIKDFKVYSNPKIEYMKLPLLGGTPTPEAANELLEQDGFHHNNGSYSENYFLNNGLNDLSFDNPGTVTVDIPAITFPKSTDKISFKVIKLDVNTNTETILYPPSSTPPFPQSNSSFVTPAATITQTVAAGQPIKIKFKVESDTHRSFKDANWNNIAVNYQTTINGNSNPINVKGIPEYPSHYITDFTAKINLLTYFLADSTSNNYYINLNKNLPGTTSFKGSFVYIIKKGTAILAKRRVEVNTQASPAVVEYDLINSQTLPGSAPVLVHAGTIPTTGFPVDQMISLQVYCNNTADETTYKIYRSFFLSKPFYFTVNNSTGSSGDIAATSINSKALNPYSYIYNNYGQFLYDQSSDMIFDKVANDYIPNPNTPKDYFGKLINPGLVQGMNSPPIGNLASCVNLPTQAEVEQCIQQNSGPYNSPNIGAPPALFPLFPFKNNNNVEKWMGKGLPEQYAMADSFKDDDSVSSLFSTASIDPEIIDMPIQGDVDTKMFGIDKRSYSRARTKTVSGSLIVVNLSNSESYLEGDKNVSTQDFIDMNGDGYPDIVYKDNAQITNATGGLGRGAGSSPGNHEPYIYNYISKSDNYQNSNAKGFSISGFKTAGRTLFGGESSTTTETDTSTPWADSGASITTYKEPTRDEGMEYYMDVNGDGLVDRFNSSGSYSLNMGYRLNGGESYSGLASYASKPTGTAGIGFDMNILSGGVDYASGMSMGFGISASLGISASMGTAERLYEDINADGLVDLIYVDGANTKVSYNLGNKFSPATTLFKNSSGNINFSNEAKTYNGGLSLGGHYYINIPICCIFIPLLYLKVGAQGSGNIGISISEVDKAFKDMNGDGFPDLVVSHSGGFTVNHSKIGRTNKLKRVTNFFSKSAVNVVEIDYGFTKPSYNDPNARLVMTESKMLNPDAFSNTYIVSTPGKDVVNRYVYENGKYDRRERDFFGFATVTINEMDNPTTIYRSVRNTYYNNGYFLNGIMRKSESFTGTSSLTSVTNNIYKLYKFKDNNTKINLSTVLPETYDTGGKEGRKMAITLQAQTSTTIFETGGNITTTVNSTYNEKGQLIKYQYISPTSSYNSVITYHDLPSSDNILNVPESITVYAGTSPSTVLRKRGTEVDPVTGDIQKLFVSLNNSESSITSMYYDLFGNIEKIEYPENGNGDIYSLEYKYDSEMYKYPVQVTDVMGYYSTSEYDPRFDVVISATDNSGNTTQYEYDAKGRLLRIIAPKELESGAPYTIEYYYSFTEGSLSYYNDTNTKFLAITRHYNELDPSNPIETIAIADGWGKIIQMKKDILLNGVERMSVSGRNLTDVHGRTIREYHPVDETKYPFSSNTGTNMKLNLSQISNYYTSSSYDAKDRVMSTTDEMLHTTNYNYAINGGLFRNTTTMMQNSSNQLKSETFVNVEGKTVRNRNYLSPTQNVDTTFGYNEIGELKSLVDPEGLLTIYDYDLAGRRVLQIHPDHGTTNYEYDTAGNLNRLFTSNLQNNPTQTYIQYLYEYNRLKEVRLPDIPSGANPANVRYDYGTAGSGNNAGKMIVKIDNSGVTKYNYGNMGEVTAEEKMVNGYNIPDMLFSTRYRYDSWNRPLSIVYPDGENVNYEYNLAGNLVKIYNKEGYEYIKDIQYDEYEQRIMVVNGNDTKSEFFYNPADRRLNRHKLSDNGGVELLKNNYTYDFVGNITNLDNSAQPFQNMGGNYTFGYEYDSLNRLISSGGDFSGAPGAFAIENSNFNLSLSYNNVGGINQKNQVHEQNGSQNSLNTYSNQYHYINGTHKVENIDNLSTGEYEKFEYDSNGNLVNHEKNGDVARMYWDEQDRLKAVNKDFAGSYQYYVYDDKGERVIKYNLADGPQLYQNGVLIDGGSIAINEYKIYPNQYVTIDANNTFTKHYYAGEKRVASRIGYQDFTMKQASNVQIDKKDLPDPQIDLKIYLEKAGIDFKNITTELSNKNGAQPNVYYLHGDHLGTANFVTEQHGDATQFFINLPFGETMAEQMTGVYDNPYKFNAKELDSETGLYYYGARYYNPRLSLWYGVDPLAVYNPVMEDEFYGDGDHNDGVFNQGNLNPYIYCYQNPVLYMDPNGKQNVAGAVLGAVAFGGIELGTQLLAGKSFDEVDWADVGIESAKGGIIGFNPALAGVAEYSAVALKASVDYSSGDSGLQVVGVNKSVKHAAYDAGVDLIGGKLGGFVGKKVGGVAESAVKNLEKKEVQALRNVANARNTFNQLSRRNPLSGRAVAAELKLTKAVRASNVANTNKMHMKNVQRFINSQGGGGLINGAIRSKMTDRIKEVYKIDK
ncbi:SpvB/TcaC N-terminal domain-containing protein [Chryseobacterium sp. Leaf201]|uniref:SpvB/TcaC N-terminal domain-containing protein n=1 Tax=Chryseobacterium sp. Leaf201 TaxID=1735672 RepID=UPI0016136FB7|nr:SpvB/TcaC N-terminal domain-containing protein [Chryseobacterium sp. Leaf201]